MYRNSESRGEIRNLWSMTKKKKSEILAAESQEIFREKVKLLKFFRKSENFSEIGGNLKQGGKCIMVSGGMDAPAQRNQEMDNNEKRSFLQEERTVLRGGLKRC